MIINVSMKMEVEEKDIEELKRITDHHIDYLLNLDEFPEIKRVFDVKCKAEIKCDECIFLDEEDGVLFCSELMERIDCIPNGECPLKLER